MEVAPDTIRIGVFGGAFAWNQEVEDLAYRTGAAIAKLGCMTVTGATSGLPHIAARGAREHDGFILGISPAKDAKEHVEVYGKPLDGCDIIMWTGNGYTGRNYLNLRNCDGAVFIGGELGTLEEFCIANYEGKVIGVLEGSGGVADRIRDIIQSIRTDHGATVLYGRAPEFLVESVMEEVRDRLKKARSDTHHFAGMMGGSFAI